nr:hypothetical protein [Tanacetum cinerariifolium]
MAALLYKDDHNKVAYLEKGKGWEAYEQILDFLNRSYIRRLLMRMHTLSGMIRKAGVFAVGVYILALIEATLERILRHSLEVPKLLVGGDLTMTEQLVTQNWMVITFHVPFWNEKWLVQGGTALELASPEKTATGKDVSNPFMAVMVCQKPLGYFSSPMIHVSRVGLVIHPPGMNAVSCGFLLYSVQIISMPLMLLVVHPSLADEDAHTFWRDQESWHIRSWRLYPRAHVHVLETVDGRVIYMFVNVSYPLSEATLERILRHGLEVPKLLVGGDLTMTKQLVRFIKADLLNAQSAV